MKKEIKLSDGVITEEVFTVPGLTVSHEKKVSDGNYGTTSYGCFYQLDLPIDATEADKAAALEQGFSIVRQAVASAFLLEAPATPAEQRIAADLGGEIIAEQPKGKTFKKEYASAGNKPSSPAAMWQELADNPTRWFINKDKPTKSYPDFKRKGTGDGLWFDKCPDELRPQVTALLQG